jgi:hypothetical protein
VQALARIDLLAMLIEQRPEDKADSRARASQIRRLIQDFKSLPPEPSNG